MFAMSEGGRVYLEGHLQENDAKRVSALLEMAARSPAVTVDCTNVRAMHASVLAALLVSAHRHKERAFSVVIVDRRMRRVFEITGAARRIGIVSPSDSAAA
jgi:anti-anti-sigma factor